MNPRTSRQWKRVRAAAYARDSRAIVRNPDGTTEVGARCWICGEPIDYSAAPQSPYAWEPDHVKPVELFPELMFDVANLAPSHSKCNRARGIGRPRKAQHGAVGVPSRDWFSSPQLGAPVGESKS